MNNIYEELITSYIANTIGIAQNFIAPQLAQHLKGNILRLDAADKLHKAGVGSTAKLAHKPAIRKDKIFWLDQKNNDEHEVAFLALIEDFITHLNMSCYTGITDYEFHYAIYEPGSFYKKHKDQFRDDAQRQFSMISYLNEDWQENDGGELVIYKSSGQEKTSPTQGKTVFFKSNELEHEVLETNKTRLSITGWLKKG